MAKWTPEELAALRTSHDFHSFGAATNYSKSFDAWETKRRRIEHTDPGLEQDEAALVESLRQDSVKSKIKDALEDAEVPELGSARSIPPYVGFNMAYFDLETTGLKGNFARMLCGSVSDPFGRVTTFRADDPDLRGTKLRDDRKLAVTIRDFLESFDIIVGWNSKMFDIPWLNTRLLIHGERPVSTDLMHIDPMYKAGRGSLALHSRSLDAVAKTFRLPMQKTVMDFEIWQDAAYGEPEAMNYVVEHCEADTLALRGAFHVLKPLIHVVHR
jgi:uncharacterized protein YprB with RNaseH-like and TPR domain